MSATLTTVEKIIQTYYMPALGHARSVVNATWVRGTDRWRIRCRCLDCGRVEVVHLGGAILSRKYGTTSGAFLEALSDQLKAAFEGPDAFERAIARALEPKCSKCSRELHGYTFGGGLCRYCDGTAE